MEYAVGNLVLTIRQSCPVGHLVFDRIMLGHWLRDHDSHCFEHQP